MADPSASRPKARLPQPLAKSAAPTVALETQPASGSSASASEAAVAIDKSSGKQEKKLERTLEDLWNDAKLKKDLQEAYDECLAKELEQAPWKHLKSRARTTTPVEALAKPGVKATMPTVKCMASKPYVAPEVPVPAVSEATGSKPVMCSPVAGTLFSQLHGEAPVPASANLPEPKASQWTGVVDPVPMPGKFGVPKAFAHMLQTKEEPATTAVASTSEAAATEWTEADWRSGGWWQDGSWDGAAEGAGGSWDDAGEEAGDDDGDGWWTSDSWWAASRVPVDRDWLGAFEEGSKREDFARNHGGWRKKRGGQHVGWYSKRYHVDHGVGHSWFERHGNDRSHGLA